MRLVSRDHSFVQRLVRNGNKICYSDFSFTSQKKYNNNLVKIDRCDDVDEDADAGERHTIQRQLYLMLRLTCVVDIGGARSDAFAPLLRREILKRVFTVYII